MIRLGALATTTTSAMPLAGTRMVKTVSKHSLPIHPKTLPNPRSLHLLMAASGKSGWDQAGGAGNTWDAGNDANGWVNKSPHGSKKNSPQQKTGQNDWPPSSKPPSHNGSLNGNGGRSQRNSPPYQGAHAWPSGSKPPINTGGWDKNSTKLASNNDYDKNNHGYNNEGGYSNGGYGTPRGAPGNSKTGQQAGPQTPYWQDASNRATGPSHAGSWRNADLAQHTGGKADQW